MQYRLEKRIDGAWWPHGTYARVERLAQAAFSLGATGFVAKIRVTEVEE